MALVAGLSFLTSCHKPLLMCRTEYLTPIYLASQQILTPDPLRDCFYGQQLIVKWNLSRECVDDSLLLVVHLRFGTRENETIKVPLTKAFGFWVYRLLNQEYWCKGGIISYQAQLWHLGELVEEWNHHLWTELIEIREEDLASIQSL